MKLYDICETILTIEEGMMIGAISFEYDNLMSAMKPGHPMEFLDAILAQIYFDVIDGKEPEIDTLKKVLKEFKEFKKAFKVKEMKVPIDALSAYIKNAEAK